MTTTDDTGLTCTGANADSLALFAQAKHELQCYIDNPVATIDEALAQSPGFAMGHVFRSYAHLLGTEPGDIAIANTSRELAERTAGNDRERGHVAALTHLVQGRWRAAGRVLEDVAIDYPLDSLALQAGHLVDFYTGNARMLRDRIARAMPSWTPAVPGYHAVLGMYAFGLEESGQYARAEALGREAVGLNDRDGWAQHAVAHVMEMQGRTRDGIAWMRANGSPWAVDSAFKVHNWWHLALYHLDEGEVDDVLTLFDGPIYGERSTIALDMIDASALLWRLQLRGIDVGEGWQVVADNWQSLASAGNYAFNDAHAVMAFASAGRVDAVAEVLESQRAAMAREDDNAFFTREVGQPVTLAIEAFAGGDYASTVSLLRPIREIAHRFGGSHAQRDLLDLTLIEAALRAGETVLARALIHERLAIKPASKSNKELLARAVATGKTTASQQMAAGVHI